MKTRLALSFTLALTFSAACQKDEPKPPLSGEEPPNVSVGSGGGGVTPGGDGGASSVVASAESDIRGVAITSADLYFVYVGTDDADAGGTGALTGVLARVPRQGGSPTIVVTGGVSPRALTFGGNALYWLDDNANTSTLVRLATTEVKSLATLAAGSVYFASTTEVVTASPAIGSISIDRIPETDAGAVFNIGVVQGDFSPVRILVDQGSVYLLVGQSPGAGLYRVPLTGGVPENIWSAAGGVPRDLAVAPGRAFVALESGADGQIVSIPLPGGAPQPFVAPVDRPAQLAVSTDRLVYTTGTGQLVQAPIAGGQATILSAEIGAPAALAVADTVAYVASGKRVLRFAR